MTHSPKGEARGGYATVAFWGAPVHGYELKSMQLFSEVNEFYRRMKQKGEIESFEVVLLHNFGDELRGHGRNGRERKTAQDSGQRRKQAV